MIRNAKPVVLATTLALRGESVGEFIHRLNERLLSALDLNIEQADGCRALTVNDLQEEYAESIAPNPPHQ